MAINDYNPFAKREQFSSTNLTAYKVLTFVSWLLVVISGAYYTFNVPEHCHYHSKHNHHHRPCDTIWGQNDNFPTPFALNSIVTSIYWIVTLILQGHYLKYLYSSDTEYVSSSANVGSHFIFNNLLIFGFIMLWVRGHLWQAELLLIVNLFNLTFLYFRHSTTPRFIHIPIVSAPFAWNYIAILWCGAAMVNAHTLPARIFANIVIWGILMIGAFYLLVFKDYTMGFAFVILTLSLALGQFFTKVFALQWISAFVIMGLLLGLSILIGIPGLFGEKGVRHDGHVVSEDRERAPLLDDQ